MKRVEHFPKKMAEREAALVASPAAGQDWDRPTAPGQFRSFAAINEAETNHDTQRKKSGTAEFCPGNANCGDRCGVVLRPPIRAWSHAQAYVPWRYARAGPQADADAGGSGARSRPPA